MTKAVTRRAFLVGAAGTLAAGWLWLRDRTGLTSAAPDTSAAGSPSTPPPSSTTTTPVPPTSMTSAPTATTTAPATTATEPPPTGPPDTEPPDTTDGSTGSATPQGSAAPVTHIDVLCRDAWGAALPTGDFREHTIDRLTVHHTARRLTDNRAAPAAIRGHQRFHQGERGWPDIAYHFIIDLEGNVYECRRLSAPGDTATNYDPTGHFLVCCEGNFNEQPLPAAQWEALIGVLAWAAARYETSPDTIRGHRDLAATSCPGDNLQSLITSGELVGRVAGALAAGGVTMEIICGEEAAARIATIEA